MSNLSDIGFPVQSEQDVNVLITETIKYVESIKCPHGIYLKFADPSGAEIYLQGNLEQELVGFNPHFDGKSRRTVSLTKAIERDSSELDGGFQASTTSQNAADSNEYPFIFDVPDFRTVPNYQLPQSREIQLTAFASNDLKIFENEASYSESQINEPKISPKSFVASGLLAVQETSENEAPPRPIVTFTGEIKEFELKINELSNEKFYWFLVDTLVGEIDVVADAKLIYSEPKIGGIASGQFWLSGKIVQ